MKTLIKIGAGMIIICAIIATLLFVGMTLVSIAGSTDLAALLLSLLKGIGLFLLVICGIALICFIYHGIVGIILLWHLLD